MKNKLHGTCIVDPTRTFKLIPTYIEPEPEKPLKWYQKVSRFFFKITNSNAFIWFMIVLLRALQGACIGILIWWFATYAR